MKYIFDKATGSYYNLDLVDEIRCEVKKDSFIFSLSKLGFGFDQVGITNSSYVGDATMKEMLSANYGIGDCDLKELEKNFREVLEEFLKSDESIFDFDSEIHRLK